MQVKRRETIKFESRETLKFESPQILKFENRGTLARVTPMTIGQRQRGHRETNKSSTFSSQTGNTLSC